MDSNNEDSPWFSRRDFVSAGLVAAGGAAALGVGLTGAPAAAAERN